MMIQSKINNHLSLILNHLYGFHSFAFYILIFNFSPQSLIPNPSPLIPNPSPLTPDPWPLTPNVIMHKYLRAEKLLYNCRETSTNIESSLQIKLFMQNKAKFRKVKFDVNTVLTKDYEQMDTWSIGKNKAKQSQNKPKQSQLKPIKANKMPKQTQFKPKQTQFLPDISVAGHLRPKACNSCPTSDLRPQPHFLYPQTRPNISFAPAADWPGMSLAPDWLYKAAVPLKGRKWK